MSDAFVKALMALENGQGLPLEAPCGEAKCPLGRIRMGIFFDGTGNNMWVDKPFEGQTLPPGETSQNGPTNVVRLYDKYGPPKSPTLDKAYHHGVGTDYDSNDKPIEPPKGEKPSSPEKRGNTRGMMFGAGGKARIEWGIRMLSEFYSNNNNWKAREKYYDVFGFSRGAALARDFVNQVRTQLISNLNKEVTSGYFSISYWKSTESREMTATAEKKNYEPIDPATVTPKFMGIFDTVAQFGWGTGDFLLDVDHTHVEYCVHYIAEDEFRFLFPVTSVFMDPKTKNDWFSGYQEPRDYKRWMSEFWYPGCHSDIGGSYLNRADIPPGKFLGITYRSLTKGKLGDLQFIPLYDMYLAMKRAKVPVDAIPKPSGRCYELYQAYCSFREDKDWANHMENAKGQYIHWYESDDYMNRFYGPTGITSLFSSVVPRDSNKEYQELLATYIHDSATESPGSTILGERTYFGSRPRLQRKVIAAAAQPKYTRKQPVRPHYLPKPGK